MVNKAHLAAGVLACVLVACSGTDGASGTKGAAGDKGTPGTAGTAGTTGKSGEASISLVSPRAAVLDGIAEVTISVDGADLPSAATVSFGAGVKVGQSVVTKRSMIVEIQVDPTAAIGPRDVVVSGPDGFKLTYAGGFAVGAGLGVKVSGGKGEQGGLVQVDLTNHDAEYFDSESFSLVPSAADGLFLRINAPYTGPKDARAILLVDPQAKVGNLGIIGTNYPGETNAPIYIADPKAVTVAARTAETLGTTEVTKVIATPFQSYLFKYTTGVNKLNVISVVPNTAALVPFAVGLGPAGKLSDVISSAAFVAYPTTVAGSGTLIVANSKFAEAGASAADFGFKATARSFDAEAPIVEDDGAQHDGAGGTFQAWGALPAANAAVPVLLLNGELKTADTADVYRVTGAANQQVEVSILGDAPVALAISSNVNFPNNANTVRATLNTKAGTLVLANAAANRFIRVAPADRRGKYTLAIRVRP